MFPFCFSRIIHFGRLIGFTEGIQQIRPADYVDGTTFFLLKHFNNEATNHYHSHTHTHTATHMYMDNRKSPSDQSLMEVAPSIMFTCLSEEKGREKKTARKKKKKKNPLYHIV